jgi:hypothetical protein
MKPWLLCSHKQIFIVQNFMAAPRVDPYNNGVILGLKLSAFQKSGWNKKINVTYGCKTAPEGWNWSELGENLGRVYFSVK